MLIRLPGLNVSTRPYRVLLLITCCAFLCLAKTAVPVFLLAGQSNMSGYASANDLTADQKLMEATHYGMRRLRERSKGIGHSWPLTFTAVLIRNGEDWRFHTLHWAMPVG